MFFFLVIRQLSLSRKFSRTFATVEHLRMYWAQVYEQVSAGEELFDAQRAVQHLNRLLCGFAVSPAIRVGFGVDFAMGVHFLFGFEGFDAVRALETLVFHTGVTVAGSWSLTLKKEAKAEILLGLSVDCDCVRSMVKLWVFTSFRKNKLPKPQKTDHLTTYKILNSHGISWDWQRRIKLLCL